MISSLMSLSSLQLAALFILGLTVFFFGRRFHVDYRLRRLGCVRAPVRGSNPLTAAFVLLKAAWKQMDDSLLDFYQALYENAAPECPNCVEVSFSGGLRFLMTQEPEHIKSVLATRFGEYGKGPNFHRVWSPFLGDSIFTTDGQKWSDNRSLIRPMFVKDRVRDIDIFDKWTQAMMRQMPASGQTVDMMDLFYRMTLDVTTDFLLGDSVNSLGNPRHEFVDAFRDVQRIQMLLTILAPLNGLVPTGRYYKGIKILERFMEPYVERTLALSNDELEKLSKSDRDFTFLHNIARFNRDRKEIRDQLMAILIAGRDTTAATLSWAIYELSHYPAVYQKLRGEVLAHVGSSRLPTYEDLKSMTYMTHTLNETLRLYPAVPYNIRAALEDTALPGVPGQPDIGILKGDIVVYSTLAMQRRRDLYPETSENFADPAVFSPDRWYHWTPKPWTFVPFNGGPRICVGQNFAMTEMAFTLVRLLQTYDRLEYRGDWKAQYHKAEVVGCPGHGVPVAFYEAQPGDIA